MDAAPERFTLTLEAAPGEVPAQIRLRHALKVFWRLYQLRCTSIEPARGPVDQTPAGHGDDHGR